MHIMLVFIGLSIGWYFGCDTDEQIQIFQLVYWFHS